MFVTRNCCCWVGRIDYARGVTWGWGGGNEKKKKKCEAARSWQDTSVSRAIDCLGNAELRSWTSTDKLSTILRRGYRNALNRLLEHSPNTPSKPPSLHLVSTNEVFWQKFLPLADRFHDENIQNFDRFELSFSLPSNDVWIYALYSNEFSLFTRTNRFDSRGKRWKIFIFKKIEIGKYFMRIRLI